MNISVLDDHQDVVRTLACAHTLSEHSLKVHTNTVKGMGQLAVRLRDAEVLVLIRERTSLNRLLLSKLPKLKLISQTGRVGPHIDVQACTDLGIAVAEGVGSPVAPAELTWALIMAAMRRLPPYIHNLKQGVWQQSGLKAASLSSNFGLGVALKGRTLGIWGYGRVGTLVAGYGRAFGMRVVIWGSESSRERARAEGHDTFSSQDQLFAESDVLSLHLRLSEQTQAIISADDLGLMKPTALLVNTARAELMAPDALWQSLKRGRPGMAAVDVFESEPVLPGHPLLNLENCICTPHLGYVEKDSYELYFGAAFDNVINFTQGQATHIVNPEVLRT
jgi:D-3-phosphoglycerate dehydrogenase